MKNVLIVNKGLSLKGNWLQFFAEGEGGDPVNPLLVDDPEPTIPEGDDEGGNPNEPDQSTFLDFGGRKVNPSDPNALNDVYKDYTELNRTFTQANQEKKALEQQLETYKQALEAINKTQPQQQQAQPQQPQAPKFTDEDVQSFDEEYNNIFYEKGKFAADKWAMKQPIYQDMQQSGIQELVNQQLAPIQQERAYMQAITDMRENYPDFEQYQDKIAELYKERADMGQPMSHENIEDAYFLVKGREAQPQATPTPEQLLQDPNFIQTILSNQDIQKQVIANYQKSVQNKQQQAPNLLGQGGNGGTPPTLGEKTPKSMQESTRAFMQYLGGL